MCDSVSEGECVLTFASKIERKAFVGEVENVEKSDLRNECTDNFLTIFGEAFLTKVRTFGSSFQREKGRSILCKIKEGGRLRPPSAHKAPQCGAFRGFETAVGRCTLTDISAVIGECQGRQTPVAAGFSRWSFRSRSVKPLFSTA